MKTYLDKITLVKNSRGVWSLDPIMGCASGTTHTNGGCYESCYAARFAKRCGIDFSVSVKRHFKNAGHLQKIRNELSDLDMPFVRLGTNGDPSEDWNHTIDVCEKIKSTGVKIVIITKHWQSVPYLLLEKLKGICINTSISALDNDDLIEHRLHEYHRLKLYCNSVLRVNTCKFNLQTKEGKVLDNIQRTLLRNEFVLDNILRLPLSHKLVKSGIVLVDRTKFLKSKVYASVNDDKTYFGNCENCPDMCGINLFRIDINNK